MGAFNQVQSLIPTAKDPYQTQNATAGTATAEGYDPSKFTVDKNQTVQGQLGDILATNSPLMQQAATRAAQQMNDRGLLNSSLGIEAGQNAVIASALPIAQQDAGTFNSAMTNTANAQNAAKQFTSGAKNTASLQNAGLQTDVSKANANAYNTAGQTAYQGDIALKQAGLQAGTQAALGDLDANTRLSLGQLDANTRLSLGQLDANTRVQVETLGDQYKTLLQGNTNAANAFNQVVNNISQIAQNNTLTQEAKDAATQSQINMLQQQLQTTGGIASTAPSPSTPLSQVTQLNLGQYFNTGVVSGVAGGTNTNGSIPVGGWRDANGQVFNPDGSPAGWQGPSGQPVGGQGNGVGSNGQAGVGAPDQFGIVNNGNGTWTFNGRTFPTFQDAYQAYAQP